MTENVKADLIQNEIDNRLTCETAHYIANKHSISSEMVGQAMDSLKLRIDKCQLGLFGYGPSKKNFNPDVKIPEEMKKVLLESESDGRISCQDCWCLANKLSISRLEMGSVCEKLEIRIKPCQLGAF